MSAPLTREAAIELLARRLYENEYRLDPPVVPGTKIVEWENQTDYVRDLYRELIEDLMRYRDAIEFIWSCDTDPGTTV